MTAQRLCRCFRRSPPAPNSVRACDVSACLCRFPPAILTRSGVKQCPLVEVRLTQRSRGSGVSQWAAAGRRALVPLITRHAGCSTLARRSRPSDSAFHLGPGNALIVWVLRSRLLALLIGLIFAFDRTGWAFDAELSCSNELLLLRDSQSHEKRDSSEASNCVYSFHVVCLPWKAPIS